MQNLARFYTTSEFDHEYLMGESTYPKSERHMIENDFSRVRRRKSGELWSIIQKVGRVSFGPPHETIPCDVEPGNRDDVGINYGRGATKFGRAKNVQNSARFLTTFDFECEYLRNGSTYRKSEKHFINYNPSLIVRTKLVNFGPPTKSHRG